MLDEIELTEEVDVLSVDKTELEDLDKLLLDTVVLDKLELLVVELERIELTLEYVE